MESPENLPSELRSMTGMVLAGERFSDIMEQAGPEEEVGTSNFGKNLAVNGILVIRAGAAKVLQHLDRAQRVLVYGVHVVLVVLDPMDEPLHFGNQRDEHPSVQHLLEDIEGSHGAHQNSLEHVRRCVGGANLVVNKVSELLDEPSGLNR